MGARLAVWLGGGKLKVQGREKIPQGTAVVFMANHQSNYDPPALIAVLPVLTVMVKKEFFRVPILGRAMLACSAAQTFRPPDEPLPPCRLPTAAIDPAGTVPRGNITERLIMVENVDLTCWVRQH